MPSITSAKKGVEVYANTKRFLDKAFEDKLPARNRTLLLVGVHQPTVKSFIQAGLRALYLEWPLSV